MNNPVRYRLTIIGSSTCTKVPKVLAEYRSGEWCEFIGEGNGLRYDTVYFAQQLSALLFKSTDSYSLKLEVRQEDDRVGKLLVFTAPAKTTSFVFAIGPAGIVDITNF